MNLLFLLCFLGTTYNQPLQSNHPENLTPEQIMLQQAIKSLPGIYSNEKALEAANIPDSLAKNPKFRPQNIIVFPIFETASNENEAYFYMGWYSPFFKETALEEAILKAYTENGSIKIAMYNIPKDKGFSEEWAKKTPFEGFKISQLENYSNTTLDISILEKNGIEIYSPYDEPFERRSPGVAAYQYINFDMRFCDDQLISKSSFLDKDKRPLGMNPLDLPMTKLKIDYKKF